MVDEKKNTSSEPAEKNGKNITVMLELLKYFPGEDVFSLLTEYFFHPDNEVRKAALQSSAISGNVEAVGHLFTLIKKGSHDCKIEAVRALGEIRVPGTVEHLIQYFTTCKDTGLKREILEAVRLIQPKHERVVELNRGVLSDNAAREKLHPSALRGLIDAGDFSFLDFYISNTDASIQDIAFRYMIAHDTEAVSPFLKRLEKSFQTISAGARASYLGACLLKQINPGLPFIIDALTDSPRTILLDFFTLLRQNLRLCSSVKSVFRFLLLAPFIDREIEAIIGDLLYRTVGVFRERSPHALNELRTMVSVHFETSFKKVQTGLTSIKRISNIEELLPLFFRHCIEKYCPAGIVEDMRGFFKKETTDDAKLLIERLTSFISEGTSNDIKRFRSCVPLFLETDPKKRYRIYTIMRNADPQISNLLRRLTRLVKAAGFLGMRGSLKKIRDVYDFAREQQVLYLEKAAIVTLCQLGSKYILHECDRVFAKPSVERAYFKSYLRGARHLPPSAYVEKLIDLLFLPDITPEERTRVVDVLSSMDLRENETVVQRLFRIFEADFFEKEEKKKAIDIIAQYGGPASLRTAVSLLDADDAEMRKTGIAIIRSRGKVDAEVSRDVVIGKLYTLLEDPVREVKVGGLAVLLLLGDDYVEKAAVDWLSSSDSTLVCEVLQALGGVLRRSLVKPVVRCLSFEDREIRERAFILLAEQAKSPLADHVKATIVEELVTVPFSDRKTGRSRSEAGLEETFLHPKLEFQIKREQSRNLTVFFTDMVGYTEKTARADITRLMSLVKQFEEVVIPTVETYNGRVVKKMGDGILAVFKHPVNATISALEIQGKIREYNLHAVDEEKFSVRVGIHTGSVLWRDNDVFGDVVNTASRLETSAGQGEVLITDTVYDEVRDFVNCEPKGEISVKGKNEAISAYVPKGVVKDVKALLEIRSSNVESLVTMKDGDSIENLKKALFTPHFFIPVGMEHVSGIVGTMQGLFRELNAAVSEVSRDFHEEYLFKRYLQDKWNETMAKLRDLK